MNPVIISRPLDSYEVAKNDAAVSVINTALSAPEFDAVLREAIAAYMKGWASFEPDVQRTLAVIDQHEYDTPEHSAAMDAFNVEYKKQEAFVDANKVFEYEGQKLLLTDFIFNDEDVAKFEVMSLTDWLAMKTVEVTSGFEVV